MLLQPNRFYYTRTGTVAYVAGSCQRIVATETELGSRFAYEGHISDPGQSARPHIWDPDGASFSGGSPDDDLVAEVAPLLRSTSEPQLRVRFKPQEFNSHCPSYDAHKALYRECFGMSEAEVTHALRRGQFIVATAAQFGAFIVRRNQRTGQNNVKGLEPQILGEEHPSVIDVTRRGLL